MNVSNNIEDLIIQITKNSSYELRMKYIIIYNDTAATIIGFLANLILMFILTKIRNKEFSVYKKILTYTTLTDLLFSTTSVFTSIRIEPGEHWIVVWIAGLVLYLPFNLIQLITLIHICLFTLTFSNNILVFLFRYYLIQK